jgi:death on curing protein
VAIHQLTISVMLRIVARVLGVDDGRGAVRDMAALAAALERVGSPFYGDDIDIRAAALLHAIIVSRPFNEGNRRIAWIACDTFCTRCGARLDDYTADQAFDLTADIAEGKLENVEAIAERLRALRSGGTAAAGG